MVRDAFPPFFYNLEMRNAWAQVTKGQLLPDSKQLDSLHVQQDFQFLWTTGPPIATNRSQCEGTSPQITHQLWDCPLALFMEGLPEARTGTELYMHDLNL